MKEQFLWLFLTAVLSGIAQQSDSSSTYRAAVVEYHPDTKSNENERVAANLANYIKFIQKAKEKGADIIVFPESGLRIVNNYFDVPDPVGKVIPCDNPTKYNKVLEDISCASKKYSIYTVANVLEKRNCDPDDENCPQKGYYILNTNVALDRKGAVIARYSKYNLFDEPNVNHMENPEIVFFDTDFGVRFGTFICFDILFPTPPQKLIQQYHITDFVFSTFWFSELPFLTALQAQRGWAEANNVNLLASGVNYPLTGSGGSGIFNGKYGQIVQVMPETATSKLLVADVPKLSRNTCSSALRTQESVFSDAVKRTARSVNFTNTVAPVVDDMKLLHDQINLYASEVISVGKKFEKTICSHNNFCCNFDVTVYSQRPESKNYVCRAMAFNGVRAFGQSFRGGVQSCGVVICSGPHINNCTNRIKNVSGLFRFEHIQIKGNFKLRNSFQMPSTLTDGKELKPLSTDKYDFKRIENNKMMEVSLELIWPTTDLFTFAIWGRDFTRDTCGCMETIESGASALSKIHLLVISFISFILFAR